MSLRVSGRTNNNNNFVIINGRNNGNFPINSNPREDDKSATVNSLKQQKHQSMQQEGKMNSTSSSSSSSSSSSLTSCVLTYRVATLDDFVDVLAMEKRCYPDDEAATPNKIKLRLQKAPQYFILCYLNDSHPLHPNYSSSSSSSSPPMLIGFINGTLSLDRTLSHASMSEHYDDGEYLCIHSVVIDQPYRRHHFASQMLINYINYIKRLSSSAATSLTSSSSSSSSTTLSVPISIKALVLVCKLHLMPLYLSVGFRFVCKSDLDYGQDTWYEHDLVLDS